MPHSISENPRERLIDRELSWLAFNQRVLELAEDESTPLLERCRFLAIFSSNLDDFYMIRVASLKRKLEAGITKTNTAGFNPRQLMTELSQKTQELIQRQSRCFHESVLPALAGHGIELTKWEALSQSEQDYVNGIFHAKIFPVLTPLAVDPSHPFPYISGLSLNLAVVVGPKTLRTWKENSAVLAGLSDGLANEGPSAGESSLLGLKLSKEGK